MGISCPSAQLAFKVKIYMRPDLSYFGNNPMSVKSQGDF